MQHGNHNHGDDSVWFSALAAGVALLAASKYPSVGINFILLLMVGWFVWSLYKITADRFD